MYVSIALVHTETKLKSLSTIHHRIFVFIENMKIVINFRVCTAKTTQVMATNLRYGRNKVYYQHFFIDLLFVHMVEHSIH